MLSIWKLLGKKGTLKWNERICFALDVESKTHSCPSKLTPGSLRNLLEEWYSHREVIPVATTRRRSGSLLDRVEQPPPYGWLCTRHCPRSTYYGREKLYRQLHAPGALKAASQTYTPSEIVWWRSECGGYLCHRSAGRTSSAQGLVRNGGGALLFYGLDIGLIYSDKLFTVSGRIIPPEPTI